MAERVHFLGIGGSGASAAAKIAEAQGFEVTGCDLEPNNEFTSVFKSSQLLKGHSALHLEGVGTNVDILAVTPAIYSLDPNNPELLEAKKKGIPVMTWQQFLGGYLTRNKFVIAVSGTHGKTTTTAMIAKILEDAGEDPTVELGAILPQWKTNYRIGKGKYFVVEADEFNDNFLTIIPDITVVTNIEMDHPEYFKDFEAVKESFKKFFLKTKSTVVANLTDGRVSDVVKAAMKESGIRYLDASKNELGIELKIPGDFNKLNAKLAMQTALLLGIKPKIIKDSLKNFTGAGRRFEYIGQYNGAKVYSDFGHHPTEIEKTMEAVREKFPTERVLLVYQPHMFSRTKTLFADFVRVFKNIPADKQSLRSKNLKQSLKFSLRSNYKTFIIDIYPSREVDTGLVTSKQLVEAINEPSVIYVGPASEALEKIKPEIKPGDIVFFMSAGDTDKLAKELVGS